MLGIKRLYTFMLQTFLPVFAMTFFICLFITLMQFLWMRIDDLVGKGLGMDVIGELFMYAALTMVPMALPLSILLASLMTFGNLGERFELTAMKAAGVSLIRCMRPLIVLMAFIVVGAFFFQNNVLPIAQTKMWTLLFSVRQKSPEMEIPEKVFYDQIPGLEMFVEHKDLKTGMLYELMIYDMSNGVDNTRIIVADSGRLSMSTDKTHLLLNIYNGEQFENLRSQTAGVRSHNLPYRRESFEHKDILLKFDANFNRMDENIMRQQYVGKNLNQLLATIDSVQVIVDSIGDTYATNIVQHAYFGIPYYKPNYGSQTVERERQKPITLTEILNVDSLLNHNENVPARSIASQALNKARSMKMDYEYKSYTVEDDRKTIRKHGIELHKKFTLSFACLLFFFIGAPLGAIIRKGGIGLPLVVSVLLFIVYYIIDNTGYKLARDGHWPVIQGIWLSSTVLLPLGIFLTYKAVHDSAVFNLDAYKAFFLKIRGKQVRELERKEFVMEEIEVPAALEMINTFDCSVERLLREYDARSVLLRPFFSFTHRKPLHTLTAEMNALIDYLSNSRSAIIISYLNKYPFDITGKKLAAIHANNQALAERLIMENGE